MKFYYGEGQYPLPQAMSEEDIADAIAGFAQAAVLATRTAGFDALREDWRESASLLGANSWQFWRFIGLPVLTPALLGTFVIH